MTVSSIIQTPQAAAGEMPMWQPAASRNITDDAKTTGQVEARVEIPRIVELDTNRCIYTNNVVQ